jgi:hypothetical protein
MRKKDQPEDNLPEEPDDENLEIDDILANSNKKKKINSKKKGNRVELALTKILTAHFSKSFTRSVGSGNRWGQVKNLPDHARTTLTGDICPPEGFKWVIECKGGYEDVIDLNSVVVGMDCAMLNSFIKQSMHDHEQSGRLPLIVWKQSRLPWMALVREVDVQDHAKYNTRLYYKGWIALPLTQLLQNTEERYWFDK